MTMEVKFPALGGVGAPEAKRLLRAIATIILASIAEEETPPRKRPSPAERARKAEARRWKHEQRRRLEVAQKRADARKAKKISKKKPSKKKAKRS